MPPRKRAKIVDTRGQDTGLTRIAQNASVPQAQCSTTTAIVPGKPRRAVRGRRGGLKDLHNMPFDIILEIVVHLHPRDLLNLARTNKEWRAFLMDRRQHALWKAARIRQEPTLPDIPTFFSEPAYANFMFFKDCMACGRPNASKVYWIFGLRLCKHTCGNLLLLSSDGYLDTRYMVSTEMGHTEYRYLASAKAGAPRIREERTAYLKSEVDLFLQRWQALATKEEKLQLLKDCHEAVVERCQVGSRLGNWDLSRKRKRSKELHSIKDERFSAVRKRLSDEGWDAELASMEHSDGIERLYNLTMKRAVKLTDKGWNNIREDVIMLMQEYRTQRLRRERRIVVEDRVRALCKAYKEYFTSRDEEPRLRYDGVELTPGDLAYLPGFVELLEADNDVKVSKASFAPLMAEERWPDHVAQWQERIKQRLRAIVLSALTTADADSNVGPDETVDVLQLAVAQFQCRCPCAYCVRLKALRWRDVLSHSCGRHNFRWPHGIRSFSDFDEYVSIACDGEVFRLPPLCLDMITREVLVACGQDPGKVTFEEMQACPVRLPCCEPSESRTCPTPGPTLDWLSAVSARGIP
ncbi:hypothetical protein C8Q70DRAFT_951554 [Cubamyces menziesii]|nr:hypothetical protein C8Q70DRAFT_951554 [Cubamyces menziesii]